MKNEMTVDQRGLTIPAEELAGTAWTAQTCPRR